MNCDTFRDMACEAFRYLIDDYGFALEETTYRCHIQYTKSRIELGLFFDASRSCEMTLCVGLANSDPSIPYDLDTLTAAINKKERKSVLRQANNPDWVQHNLKLMANDLRPCMNLLLSNTDQLFTAMQSIRMASSEKYASEAESCRIRGQANKAWASKNYTNVVKQYRLLGDRRTESELMKMQYAEKQVKANQ